MIAWVGRSYTATTTQFAALPVPLRAAIYSFYLTVATLWAFVTAQAISDGAMDTFGHYVAFLEAHWWAALIASIIGPAARALKPTVAPTTPLPPAPPPKGT